MILKQKDVSLTSVTEEPKDNYHKLCFCKFQVVSGETPNERKSLSMTDRPKPIRRSGFSKNEKPTKHRPKALYQQKDRHRLHSG